MNKYRSQHGFYEVRNGFLYATYLPNKVVDLEKMKDITLGWQSLIGDKVYPSIVDGNEVSYITKQAREYASTSNGLKGVLSIAIVVNNPVMYAMASFFMAFNKPLVPTKLFPNIQKAEQWSAQYKK